MIQPFSKITHLIPDKIFLRIKYRRKFGVKLSFKSPKTFNEKLQWLKVYNRKQLYTTMVDKFEAKKYVASVIGKEYTIPTLGIYDSFDEIDFDTLPDQFVIKCTHDSGGLVICRDKSKLNIEKTKEKICNCLKNNYYYGGREWPYKNVKPRIIIEKYMEDKNSKTMRDYKIFCFSGKPKILYLSEGLEDHSTASMSFYDMNMQLTDCRRSDYKPLNYKPQKPKNFEKMKEFSSLFSKNIPHLRVDWYEVNGKLFFGEFTFTTCGGYVPFAEEKWNKRMGSWIKLEKSKERIK